MTNFHLGRFLGKRCEVPGQEGLVRHAGGGRKQTLTNAAVQFLERALEVFTAEHYAVDFVSIQLEVARALSSSLYSNKATGWTLALNHVFEARKGLAVLQRQEREGKAKGDDKSKSSQPMSFERCSALVEAELSFLLREAVKFFAGQKDPKQEKTEALIKELYREYLMEKKAGTNLPILLERLSLRLVVFLKVEEGTSN